MEADKLNVGETLRTMFDTHLKVKHITHRGPPEPVYNITVHNEHTYFISHSALLVHNNNGYDDLDSIDQKGTGVLDDNSTTVHKNSLDYVGETHVYRIRGPEGTYKIGESAQGVRVRGGASIRGEQQARRFIRETGDLYESEIRRTFPDKRSAREYETRLIERCRRMFGDDALPGNKTNR